jgi:hypothetical protein
VVGAWSRFIQAAIRDQVGVQTDRDDIMHESGAAEIDIVDEEGYQDGKMIGDSVIDSPGGACYFVLEVAYTQSRKDVQKKVDKWLLQPTVQGVVVIYVTEDPAFQANRLNPMPPTHRQMLYEDWIRTAEVSDTGTGPIKQVGITWANTHSMEVAIFPRNGERTVQVGVPLLS